MNDLHGGNFYVIYRFSTIEIMPPISNHKQTALTQRILDRLRFPLLGLLYRVHPKHLRSRSILPFYLNRMGLIGKGVEIGVQRGLFSEHLLHYWEGEELICVDPWLEFPISDYDEPKDNCSQQTHDEFYSETQSRLSPFGKRARIIRNLSSNVAEEVEDKSLDFVFIDGQHDYISVSRDINMWAPKIRNGGLLCGHDWKLDYGPPRYGVEKAVREFAELNRAEICITADNWTWYFHLRH